VDAAGPVDAQTAPTGPWKTADGFPQAPTAIAVSERIKDQELPRLRAGKESDDTQTPYRVAAFQTFLSGRI
jgi:hypothetical protein